MVQIALPKNSKVKKGNFYKDKTGSKNIKKVNVYRWDPSTDDNPRLDTYEVDMDNCPSKVLDVLNKIKNEIDPSLAYRRSCAHGVCGSCDFLCFRVIFEAKCVEIMTQKWPSAFITVGERFLQFSQKRSLHVATAIC